MLKWVKVEAGTLAAFHWVEVTYHARSYTTRFVSTSDVLRGHMTGHVASIHIYSDWRIFNPADTPSLLDQGDT